MVIRHFTTHVLAILAASPPVATYACPNVEELCQALAERLSLGRNTGKPVCPGRVDQATNLASLRGR